MRIVNKNVPISQATVKSPNLYFSFSGAFSPVTVCRTALSKLSFWSWKTLNQTLFLIWMKNGLSLASHVRAMVDPEFPRGVRLSIISQNFAETA